MFEKLFTKAKDNANTIMTALGLVSLVGAVATALNAEKPKLILDEVRRKKAIENDIPEEDVEVTILEKGKALFKAYWPTLLLIVAGVGLVSSSDYISIRRETAVMAAYTITEKSFDTFKAKTEEMLGKEKTEEIQKEADRSGIKAVPKTSSTIVLTGRGNTLCFDSLSGRYFLSDTDIIKRAEYHINERLYDEMRVSVNEFYEEIGLPACDLGREMCWDVQDGAFKIRYNSTLTDDDNPVLVLNYNVIPYFMRSNY